MKRLFLSIIIFLCALTNSALSAESANATALTYAHIDCSTPLFITDSASDYYLLLPPSHFVTIISKSGTDHYLVNYADLTGYILASDITISSYEPVVKYALGSAVLLSGIASIYLYQSATLTAIVTSISIYDTIAIYGEYELDSNLYFCRVTSVSGDSVYGYIPDIGITATLPIANSGELIIPPTDDSDSISYADPLSANYQIALGLAISIPTIFAVCLLFKRTPTPPQI